MLNSFKQKDGRIGVILWGEATKEPQIKTTKNGDKMAWFYVRYGYEPQQNPSDKPRAKTIKILAYKDVANVCEVLEAWESVFVCGYLKEDEYNGQKEYSVTAELVLAPNAQIAAITALKEVRDIKSGKSTVPSGKDSSSSASSSGGYNDIDQADIDDIFPGL